MNSNDSKKSEEIRKRHNLDLIKRMKEGESLKTIDSMSSWFPPRPVIKKDLKALARLYDKSNENKGEGEMQPSEPLSQVPFLKLTESEKTEE